MKGLMRGLIGCGGHCGTPLAGLWPINGYRCSPTRMLAGIFVLAAGWGWNGLSRHRSGKRSRLTD